MKITDRVVFKNTELANRVVSAPIATMSCTDDGAPTARTLDIYQKMCESNVGLLVVEHHAVHQCGRVRQKQLEFYSDASANGPLAEVFRTAGITAVAQLNHCGGKPAEKLPHQRYFGPSDVPVPGAAAGVTPEPMSASHIDDTVRHFVDATGRAIGTGYRGVQIHAAHGYLLGQFMSPATNRRTDDWGGYAMGRGRFLCAVLDAVRSTYKDAIVGVRLGAADYFCGDKPTGLRPEDSAIVAREVARLGADWVSVSGNLCGYGQDKKGRPWFADFSRLIKESVGGLCPVECTGGVASSSAAQELLETGACDMVGVGRYLVAHPKEVAAWLR